MAEQTNTPATPRNHKIPNFINKNVDKKALGRLLAEVYENHGNAVAARLGNNLKNLGFKYFHLIVLRKFASNFLY